MLASKTPGVPPEDDFGLGIVDTAVAREGSHSRHRTASTSGPTLSTSTTTTTTPAQASGQRNSQANNESKRQSKLLKDPEGDAKPNDEEKEDQQPSHGDQISPVLKSQTSNPQERHPKHKKTRRQRSRTSSKGTLAAKQNSTGTSAAQPPRPRLLTGNRSSSVFYYYDDDDTRSRQSSTIGLGFVPEVPNVMRRDSGVTLDMFVIPEPEFSVNETITNEQSTLNIPNLQVGGEIVYRIWLNFGDMGEWSIYVTRTDLSALISKLKLNRMLAIKTNITNIGQRLGRHKSMDPGRPQLERSPNSRRIILPQVSERNVLQDQAMNHHHHQQQHRDQNQNKQRGRSPQRATSHHGGDQQDSSSQHSTGPDGHLVLRMSKLLFVPAMGSAARIRKVKADRRRLVKSIFQSILCNETIRNAPFVKEFLCISTLTFDTRFGKTYKEGWVRVTVTKRDRENEKLQWKGKISCFCCICACAPDPQRAKTFLQPSYRRNRWLWAVVKPSFIAFFDQSPHELDAREASFVILYSHNYEINKSYSTTGSHRAIHVVGDSLNVRLKLPTRWQKKVWSRAMRDAFQASSVLANTEGNDQVADAGVSAGWCDTHQNQSFAPRRLLRDEPGAEMCMAKFHIDAENYFKAVYEAIDSAESQIFIQGWWVCANLPLLRPSRSNDKENTLGGILEKKAKQGVKISILMYNEVSLALPLDSAFQEKEFRKLEGQQNISVLRHPMHKIKKNSIWFWSHHEKIVVIDQTHSFCGGIDLSWGRYDTHSHRLYDPHAHARSDVGREWPGIDFSNVRDHDFENVSDFSRIQHAGDCPRMPWHDVQCEYWGSIARDIARHFIHQWNHARFANADETLADALVPMDVLPHQYRVNFAEIAAGQPVTIAPHLREFENDDDNLSDEGPAEDIGPPGSQPSSPVSSLPRSRSNSPVPRRSQAKDDDIQSLPTITESDIDEEEQIGREDDDDSDGSLPPPPELHGEMITEPTAVPPPNVTMNGEAAHQNGFHNKKKSGPQAPNPELDMDGKSQESRPASMSACSCATQGINENVVYHVNAQVVRSLGLWSGSTPGEKERSIEKAMRNLIEDAERFIYIENQFFISGLDSDNEVANRVLDALFKRILRAHQARAEFKVMILIPLIPGFDGYISESPSIRRVLFYEYRCINRGSQSLFYNLLRKGINPDDYVHFFGLRAWEPLSFGSSKAAEVLGMRRVATELVYVHSKVLVVDDVKCIIGSGNINDRSLTGNRDTELAVVIEASNTGKNFVRNFRLSLMSEHWGIQDNPHDPLWKQLRTPWHKENFKELCNISQTNTQIFEDIFPCIPRDDVRDSTDLRNFSRERYTVIESSNAIEDELSHIKGHIVDFPLRFLEQYDLKPGLIEDTSGALLGNELFI